RTLAAQHRVRGPRRRPPELRRADPAHAAVEARLLEDRLREVGPGAIAGGGEMPHALRLFDELANRDGEVADVRRRAALVVDDGDLVALLPEREHRAEEVLARPAEEPGGAHDPGVLAGRSFAQELRPPVRRLRVRRVRLEVRLRLAPVEDVVAR